MTKEILIVGGGVSGVTTGIVLLLLGYRTRIVCRHWLGDVDSTTGCYSAEPRFASQYPAASIIPHSVKIEDEEWHLQTNLRLFDTLHFLGTAGVRKQRHYEIFEEPCVPESYATAMRDFCLIPNGEAAKCGAPQRDKVIEIFGWSFETLFAEMPRYRRFLTTLYLKLGGVVESGRFISEAVLNIERAETIINCGGAWGPRLWGDSASSRFVQGTLIRINPSGRIPRNRVTNEVFSYNYHPLRSVYASIAGASADVYFYPRADGWLLGGTRIESSVLSDQAIGFSDEVPPWSGGNWNGPTVAVPKVGDPGKYSHVPRPIVDLNRDLIRSLTGIDIEDFPMEAMTGYRHKRETVRLEVCDQISRRVIHNYGHGGAGVTLSWSCGVWVASIIDSMKASLLDLEQRLIRAVND
jgi:D-amino-acid oxidase